MLKKTKRAKASKAAVQLPAAKCDYCGGDVPDGKGLLIVAPVRQAGEKAYRHMRFCNWREAFAFLIFLIQSEWDAAKATALVQHDPSDEMYM